jgi:hypothetical protein
MEESLLKIIEDDERTESTLVPDEEMHALIDDSGPEEKKVCEKPFVKLICYYRESRLRRWEKNLQSPMWK